MGLAWVCKGYGEQGHCFKILSACVLTSYSLPSPYFTRSPRCQGAQGISALDLLASAIPLRSGHCRARRSPTVTGQQEKETRPHLPPPLATLARLRSRATSPPLHWPRLGSSAAGPPACPPNGPRSRGSATGPPAYPPAGHAHGALQQGHQPTPPASRARRAPQQGHQPSLTLAMLAGLHSRATSPPGSLQRNHCRKRFQLPALPQPRQLRREQLWGRGGCVCWAATQFLPKYHKNQCQTSPPAQGQFGKAGIAPHEAPGRR